MVVHIEGVDYGTLLKGSVKYRFTLGFVHVNAAPSYGYFLVSLGVGVVSSEYVVVHYYSRVFSWFWGFNVYDCFGC